jgi:predicted metal-dependent hydrolase
VTSPLPYQIETSRNRTSRATLRDGKILIRLARGLSQGEEKKHIENLLRRMTKAAVKEGQRTMIDPFRPLLEGAESQNIVLVTGTVIDLKVVSSDARRTTALRHASQWIIRRSVHTDLPTFHRFLWKLVSMHVQEEIDHLVRQINEGTFHEEVRSVKITFLRSRWGSCSLGRNITLATPLLFTTPAILRYVIIHELAHILHHDHSRRFWDAVAAHDPDFRTSLKALKQMRLPSFRQGNV